MLCFPNLQLDGVICLYSLVLGSRIASPRIVWKMGPWKFQNRTMRTSVGSNPVIVGSKIGIFGGFEWVRNSIWVDEPGFGRVRSSVFPDLGLGSTYIWLNRFEVRTFCRGSKGFEVQFCWTNLSSKEFDLSSSKQFKVQYICVRSNTNVNTL